ncbi:MAG: flagellar hook-basal body complex protein FliE [Buchnera aphidicola (Ceratovacuna japonica)]
MIINEPNIITKFHELSNKINIKKYNIKNNFYKFFNREIEKNYNFKKIRNHKIDNFLKNDKINKKTVSDVMLDLEKSSLYLEIAVKVRNKIMSAYQEIMNMQI